MSKDEYQSLFSRQMKTVVLILLQTFFATHAVLKISLKRFAFEIFAFPVLDWK